jgi:hypothetical protein
MPDIKKVSVEEAENIIETREPIGLFYCIEKSIHTGKNVYIGIDNSYGDAWTEEFHSLVSCKKYLEG